MHPEAHAFVADVLKIHQPDGPCLEFGSRDVNGTIRDLLDPSNEYHGVDIMDGPNVDEVADAATYETNERYALVACLEVFEHAEEWPSIIRSSYEALRHGGTAIFTAAGPERAPHSAYDGFEVREGEWYENVDPTDLEWEMRAAGFLDYGVVHNSAHGDVYAWGVK